MKKTVIVDLNDLNPFVRQAGYQGSSQWPNHNRKIYDHELFFIATVVEPISSSMVKKNSLLKKTPLF